MNFLRTFGWFACCFYASIPSFWLLIHPRVNAWRARILQRRPVYKVLVPLWVLMWFALFALTFPIGRVLLYREPWTWIPAILLFAAGIFLYLKGGHGFSPLQISGHHEVEPERHAQKLVVTGIRRHVRHPIYLGHLCEMFAWSIGTGLLSCWVLTAFAIITGIVMVRAEERELVFRFGESYRDYQQRVPAIVPKF